VTATTDIHGVVVVGRSLAAQLRDAGVTDAAVMDRELLGSVFDDDTDTWTVTARGGQTCRGRIVIAGSPFAPWIPDIRGRNDFDGVAFPAVAPDPKFDPTGRRIAVIGSDSAGGQFIERAVRSAASVTVFPLPPRRVVSATRIDRRRRRRTSLRITTSPIDTVTASGIRTVDGTRHDLDTIVYGTGFAVADRGATLVGTAGLTIRQAWRDGMEPYLGIAVHGFPNYFFFFIAGTDTAAQARDVASCLQLMTGAAGRIEVRRSSQQVFSERVHLRRPRRRPAASAFDLSSSGILHDDLYDGEATLTVGDTRRRVHARLTGHLDPIDGQYHWQGTIFDHLPDDVLKHARAVTLAVGVRNAPARITEQTPQGTHSITGVGAPPFTLDDVELSAPPL
jgi:cation diffusion facilitator CzcD-associated flavoprotein CzcO